MASRCDFDGINNHMKTQLILGTTSTKLKNFVSQIKTPLYKIL